MTADEQQLIEKMKTGDRTAFREVVEKYKRKVYYLALDLIGNHDDAEDLSQEVFIKVFKSVSNFKGDSKFSTWIHRVTINTYIDHTRSQKMMTTSLPDYFSEDNHETESFSGKDHYKNPELVTEGNQIQIHVQQALEKLTPREKTIFVMRHYQELQNKEISEILNITEGTVKTLMFRAVQKLQQHLSFYRPDLGLENEK